MRGFFIAGAILAVAAGLCAQVPQVRISQDAETKQEIGLASVSVSYSRPGVKGRKIWGELLKYGVFWRAGANDPTRVTFSDDVSVAGKPLKAGTYRYAVFPMESGPWTIAFSSDLTSSGAVYDSSKEVLSIKVEPVAAAHEEWLSFSFEDLTWSSANLVLRWEKISLSVPVSFNTEAIFAKAAGSSESDTWRVQNNYARYVLENGGDLQNAMKAAETAVMLNESAATLRTKAELQAKMGKKSDAVKTIEKAIAVGKAQNPGMNTTAYDNLLKEWKGTK